MKRALIFDMDGLIVDNDRYHCLSWMEFAKKHGKDVGYDEVKSWFGSTNRTILGNLFPDALSREQVEQMGREKEELYRRMYAKTIEPLKGLKEFLAGLDGAFKIGVATSAPTENVDFVLGKTGLKSYFQSVTDESDIRHGKPDPEIFLKAAGKLGVPPDSCLVFEDSFHGIEAARRAGMYVIGVATTHEAGALKNTDLVIADFSQINAGMIEAIFEGKQKPGNPD